MARFERMSQWDRIREALNFAMVVVLREVPNKQVEDQFDAYMANNEFGLAYEAMLDLGKDDEQLPEYWATMTEAKRLMKLP